MLLLEVNVSRSSIKQLQKCFSWIDVSASTSIGCFETLLEILKPTIQCRILSLQRYVANSISEHIIIPDKYHLVHTIRMVWWVSETSKVSHQGLNIILFCYFATLLLSEGVSKAQRHFSDISGCRSRACLLLSKFFTGTIRRGNSIPPSYKIEFKKSLIL